MRKNFWVKLKRPLMVAAPMSGVTDEVFRLMLLKYGRPDVFWTEFVSVDALCFALANNKAPSRMTGLNEKADKKVKISKKQENAKNYCLNVLKHSKKQKPIVAQIFGANPENFEKAGAIIAKLGFDGIDINMGCPDRAVESQGAGAGLIKNPELAKEIIKATKKAGLPVSVKTRIGYNKNEIEKWIPALLEENIACLTVHFRTKKEMYMGQAHWELAREIVALRNKIAPETLILGNGDVKNLEQAKQLARENNLDGIMVGRALLGNPWLFSGKQPNLKKRLAVITEHAKLFSKLNNKKYASWESMKKHFHAYAKDFPGAKDLRDKLMKVKSAKEVKALVDSLV